MTKRYYAELSMPEIAEGKEGGIEYVNHSHRQNINFDDYGCRNKGLLKSEISRQLADVRGCHAFFKSIASNPDIKSTIKALAEAAAAEDEAQIVELEKHKSTGCCFL